MNKTCIDKRLALWSQPLRKSKAKGSSLALALHTKGLSNGLPKGSLLGRAGLPEGRTTNPGRGRGLASRRHPTTGPAVQRPAGGKAKGRAAQLPSGVKGRRLEQPTVRKGTFWVRRRVRSTFESHSWERWIPVRCACVTKERESNLRYLQATTRL